jgi:coat protein Gp5
MSQDLTQVIPQLLAQGLLALRQNSIMPLLVNRSYEALAGEKGSTIDVPIPSAIAVQDVTPANVPPSTAGVTPTSVPITLDQWKEAPFYMTDKDLLESMNGTIPMQASEAIKALSNVVDSYILAQYTSFYGFRGEVSTGAMLDPFSDDTVKDITALRAILDNQLCPPDDRRIIANPNAEMAALNLRAFHDAQFSGSAMGLLNGTIGQKFGFSWFKDQNVPNHTAGTCAAKTVTETSNSAIGVSVVTLKVSTTTGTLVVGDIISFAGSAQTYVVTAAATVDTVGVVVSIYPPLLSAVDGSGTAVAVTVQPSHAVNLGFHRDAIAFATRPLVDSAPGLGAMVSSAVDPVSGLVLRLEVTREHKRTRYSYDILYGAKVIRPQLGARLGGATG